MVKEDSGLHVGMRNGPLEVVKLLIDADRELLGLVNGAKESPLFPAVEGGSFHIAKHIIEKFLDSLPPCGGDNAMNALRAAVVRTHHRGNLIEVELRIILLLACLVHFSLSLENIVNWDWFAK